MSVFESLRERGFVQQHTQAVAELLDGPPRTFYVGFDPTASSLHIGHLLPIMAMAHLQRAGHRPIAVVGGGTAMVGDPSGKEEARPILTPEMIEANKAGQRRQLALFLDFSEGAGQLVDNADWLLPLNYIDFLREIGRHFSVNVMMSKASVKLRLERGLSFLEFNYQILQAYDFLELYRRDGCVLQMGGDDQWGNITAGIDLIRRVEGAEAHGLTFPLITTATGAKMGKTAAGAVFLDAERCSPYDYFQYWINVDDRDVGRFLRLFTFLSMDRIRELEALTGADIREAKRVLAVQATALVHGAEAAQRAEAGARAAFGGGGAADAMPSWQVAFPVPIIDALVGSGLCKSKGAARRMIRGNGVGLHTARNKVADADLVLTEDMLGDDGALVIWRGKKNAVRVRPA